jgi:uncharacterized membrane protein
VPTPQGDGLAALGASLAIAGLALGLILIASVLLAQRWPETRRILYPMNLLIVIAQLLDGATTWIGVMNPFNLDLPNFEETVWLSRVILDNLGGFAYFIIKACLGVVIVGALEFAFRHARTWKEFAFARLVQLSLIVVSFIPVGNNVMNFIVLQ